MYDYCLFDLDGTLTDPKIGITNSVAYALNHFGIKSDPDELIKFIGPPIRDSFRIFYGMNETDIETAVEKYREYFPEKGIYENTLYPGTNNMLEKLSKQSDLVIATSKPTVYAKIVADHFGFTKYFKDIAGSELDGRRSKKSEIITYIKEEIIQNSSKSIIMIGDRQHDIIGAKETGIKSIGVTWGYGSREELTNNGADYIVDNLEELLSLLEK